MLLLFMFYFRLLNLHWLCLLFLVIRLRMCFIFLLHRLLRMLFWLFWRLMLNFCWTLFFMFNVFSRFLLLFCFLLLFFRNRPLFRAILLVLRLSLLSVVFFSRFFFLLMMLFILFELQNIFFRFVMMVFFDLFLSLLFLNLFLAFLFVLLFFLLLFLTFFRFKLLCCIPPDKIDDHFLWSGPNHPLFDFSIRSQHHCDRKCERLISKADILLDVAINFVKLYVFAVCKFGLDLIHYRFQYSAIPTIWGEEFHEFVGTGLFC